MLVENCFDQSHLQSRGDINTFCAIHCRFVASGLDSLQYILRAISFFLNEREQADENKIRRIKVCGLSCPLNSSSERAGSSEADERAAPRTESEVHLQHEEGSAWNR